MEMGRYRHRKRLAVNVSLNGIVKYVKCDHPCSEGHEPGNLISSNFLEKSKGFLAERFIKPPVTLTFEFTCEIDLKYVVIQCYVGAQKTSGIELSIQPYSDEKQYESVSSGVLKDNEKGFVFHRYSENVRAKFGEEFCFRSFKSSRTLIAAKRVRLKIFRTEGSSVPGLGKVEIWGVPCKRLPIIENSSIKRRHVTQTSQPEEGNEIKPNGLKLSSKRKSLSSSCGGSQTIKVPDDFIDPITCDIMCQPVTLPSGKVIDISTLESYERAESEWGRGPSDPFTGIPLTSSSKPIAASDLKARIDKFLCDNSNNPELLKIPRTVGRSLASSQKVTVKPSVSKLITNKRQMSPCSLTNNPLTKYNNSFESKPTVKRGRFEEKINHNCEIQLDLSKRELLATPNNVKTSPVPSSNKTISRMSFQERMEKSLELSLRSTLSSLPSFTADDEKCSDKSLVECNACKLCDNLFSIPCCHFICRNCLVSLKKAGSLSCSICKSSFESHDVQKVHTGINTVNKY